MAEFHLKAQAILCGSSYGFYPRSLSSAGLPSKVGHMTLRCGPSNWTEPGCSPRPARLGGELGSCTPVGFQNRQFPATRPGGLLATQGPSQHEETRLPNGDSHRAIDSCPRMQQQPWLLGKRLAFPCCAKVSSPYCPRLIPVAPAAAFALRRLIRTRFA